MSNPSLERTVLAPRAEPVRPLNSIARRQMQMRASLSLLAIVLTAGCASGGVPYAQRFAQIVFDDSPAHRANGGIEMIDHHWVFAEPGQVVRVPVGPHIVTYSCPGKVYIHLMPTLAVQFDEGASYTLRCNSDGSAVLSKA